MKARLIAFYLPQFHPIPENDQWWGRGFTEWTNVARARPLFRGHYQPHVPADLGFYDLRLPEVRCAQANMARAAHIEGFCYWHYWFEGKRLLERPFNEVLASGQPDLPFCLAWANESWSRRWLGEPRQVLMAQTHSPGDDLSHIRWLLSAFADHRYLRMDGRPLFLVYRPCHLPDPRQTTDTFREECVRHGLPEPYLVGIDAHCLDVDCRTLGFDSTLQFEPQLGLLPDALSDGPRLSHLRRNLRRGNASPTLKLYDYAAARELMRRPGREAPTYPCVFVAWDNVPRRGSQGVIIPSTPALFEAALAEAIASVQDRAPEERLVFVNAWNEWAEGNHLEPDLKHGRAYLEAVRRVNTAPVAVGA